MGSARKLSQKNREIKLQTVPSATAKIPFGRKSEKLGVFLAFRHPLNPFFYNKTRRRAPGLRASNGYRNHYSWYWRKYLLKTVDTPLKAFSITGTVKLSDAFKKQKEKTGTYIGLDNKQVKRKSARAEHPKIEEKTETIPKKAEKPTGAKQLPEEFLIITEPKMAKAEPVAEMPKIEEKTAKNVKIVHYDKATPIEVKTPEIQTEKPEPAKSVPKNVKAGKSEARVYKTVATTKTPRTSTIKVHAEDGRRKVGNPPNTSNSDFARVIPSFSLFSISVKLLKMKPEGIIRTVEFAMPRQKNEAKPEVKTEVNTGIKTKSAETDNYHALNRARNRLLYPKIASGAADSLN